MCAYEPEREHQTSPIGRIRQRHTETVKPRVGEFIRSARTEIGSIVAERLAGQAPMRLHPADLREPGWIPVGGGKILRDREVRAPHAHRPGARARETADGHLLSPSGLRRNPGEEQARCSDDNPPAHQFIPFLRRELLDFDFSLSFLSSDFFSSFLDEEEELDVCFWLCFCTCGAGVLVCV